MPAKAKTEALCEGVTKAGQPCKNAAKGDTGLCWRHAKEGGGAEEGEENVPVHSKIESPKKSAAKGGVSEGSVDQDSKQPADAAVSAFGFHPQAPFSFGSTNNFSFRSTIENSSNANNNNNNNTETSAHTGDDNTATPDLGNFRFDFPATTSSAFPSNLPAFSIPTSTDTTTAAAASNNAGGGCPSFKVVIVGDGGVGKTSFVEKWLKNEYPQTHQPTIGVQRDILPLNTSIGDVNLDLWDVAGLERYGGLRDGYYIGAQAAILCFDVTSKISYKNIPTWHRDIVRVCSNIPIILVGLKADMGSQKQAQHEQISEAKAGQEPPDAAGFRTVVPSLINFHRKKNLQYYDVSTKTLLNIGKPFTYLLQKLVGNPKLQIEHSLLVGATGEEEAAEGEAEEHKETAPSRAPLNTEAASRFPTADPAASTPSFHLSGALNKDAQPSPFESRFGSNTTALSFQPVSFSDSMLSNANNLSVGSSPFSSAATTGSAFSPFAIQNPSFGSPADGTSDVAALAAQFGGGFSLGRSPAPSSQTSGEKKTKGSRYSTAAFLAQDLEDEDEEADPDYDPALDFEGDEGDEGDEGEDYFGAYEFEGDEGDEGEEKSKKEFEEQERPTPKKDTVTESSTSQKLEGSKKEKTEEKPSKKAPKKFTH